MVGRCRSAVQIDDATFEHDALRRMKRRSFRPLFFVLAGIAALSTAIAFAVTQPVWGAPRGAQPGAPEVASRLEDDVRAFSSMQRDVGHPEGLEGALGAVRERFEALGLPVEVQRYEVRGALVGNVVTHVGPESGPRVVVGAHYDTCGPHPGADDNASGVAGLLELARTFAHDPPGGRIDLVAYTLEEPPYFATADMGSAVHAAALARDGVQVKAMVALEMIGTFSDAPDSQHFPSSLLGALYPSRGDFIAVVGDFDQVGLVRSMKRSMTGATSLPVRSINAPRSLVGIDFSDHRSYWAHDVPAVMVTDTAFFRNERYHGDGDTPVRLDYPRMACVVTGVEAAVRSLATPVE